MRGIDWTKDNGGTLFYDNVRVTIRVPPALAQVGRFEGLYYRDSEGEGSTPRGHVLQDMNVVPLGTDALRTCAEFLTAAEGLAQPRPAVQHAVDALGRYLGTRPVGQRTEGEFLVPYSPPQPNMLWQGKGWHSAPSLADYRERGADAIDFAATRARAKYLTGVPGQEYVYAIKADQAREWIREHLVPLARCPLYIKAEADERQMPPIDVAREIVAQARTWAEELGPRIESLRVGGKQRVRAATTPDQIASIVQSVSNLLRGI